MKSDNLDAIREICPICNKPIKAEELGAITKEGFFHKDCIDDDSYYKPTNEETMDWKEKQCFCQSYADDYNVIRNCTCGRCNNTKQGSAEEKKEKWQEEFYKKLNRYSCDSRVSSKPITDFITDLLSKTISETLDRAEQNVIKELVKMPTAEMKDFKMLIERAKAITVVRLVIQQSRANLNKLKGGEDEASKNNAKI